MIIGGDVVRCPADPAAPWWQGQFGAITRPTTCRSGHSVVVHRNTSPTASPRERLVRAANRNCLDAECHASAARPRGATRPKPVAGSSVSISEAVRPGGRALARCTTVADAPAPRRKTDRRRPTIIDHMFEKAGSGSGSSSRRSCRPALGGAASKIPACAVSVAHAHPGAFSHG